MPPQSGDLRRIVADRRPTLGILILAAIGCSGIAGGEEPPSLSPQPWSCCFGGQTVDLRYRLSSPVRQGTSVPWSFAVQERVVARREAAIAQGSDEVRIRLEPPGPPPGIILPATVSLALGTERLDHRLWIFPQDPFEGHRDRLASDKISLFDPHQMTARLLEQFRVPFRPVRSASALEGIRGGVIVIGEGVSFQEWRTLAQQIVETAARGVPVICLAPACGEIPLPGLGTRGMPRPADVFFRQADAITAMDKRLDTFWLPDGRVAASRLALVADRSGIVGRITTTDEGWPWLEVVFPEKGSRLILCGFAIVAKWDSGPTPRFLLASLLEYVARIDQRRPVN